MPVTLGSTHVKVKFSPLVEEAVGILAEHEFDYIQHKELGNTKEYLAEVYDFLPFKLRHYLNYCADRAVILGAKHNYVNVSSYRVPEGCWSIYEGGLSFTLYTGSGRGVCMFDEENYRMEGAAKGTLVLTETQPGKWIASVRSKEDV